MNPDDFTYWGECRDCDKVMDESDARQCPHCERWHCRACYKKHEAECAAGREEGESK